MPTLNKTTKQSYTALRPKRERAHPIHGTNRWKVASSNYRKTNVWCEYHLHVLGSYVPCDCVDHVVALNNDGEPYDTRNLMALSTEAHGTKSAMEGQGYQPGKVPTGNGKYIPASREQVLNDMARQRLDG